MSPTSYLTAPSCVVSGAGDRNRTGTIFGGSQDFKSCASACSATPAEPFLRDKTYTIYRMFRQLILPLFFSMSSCLEWKDRSHNKTGTYTFFLYQLKTSWEECFNNQLIYKYNSLLDMASSVTATPFRVHILFNDCCLSSLSFKILTTDPQRT